MSDRPTWIAKLVEGNKVKAVLKSDGKWISRSETLQLRLSDNFDPMKIGGLGRVLPFGVHAANLAGAALGLRVIFSTDHEPADPELIS